MGGPEAASEGSTDSDTMAPSASEISDDAEDVDPAVQLYHQRMRRPPVFPVSKLMQRVSLYAERSSPSTSRGHAAWTAETHGHPLATLQLERCMKCCCSAFRDVLVLAGPQAGVGREAEALPFRRMRNREGRLFAAKAADVPPVMAAEEALAFPVKLGSLTYRLAFTAVQNPPKTLPTQ